MSDETHIVSVAAEDFMASPSLGLIVDIQRFSIHDGPGIRAMVFLNIRP